MTVSVEINKIEKARFQSAGATWVGEAVVSYDMKGKPEKMVTFVVADRLGWGRSYGLEYKESGRAVSSDLVYDAIRVAIGEKLPEPKY